MSTASAANRSLDTTDSHTLHGSSSAATSCQTLSSLEYLLVVKAILFFVSVQGGACQAS